MRTARVKSIRKRRGSESLRPLLETGLAPVLSGAAESHLPESASAIAAPSSMKNRLASIFVVLSLATAGCGDGVPAGNDTVERYAGIEEDETVLFRDPEGNWRGQVQGSELQLTHGSGGQIVTGAVERFAGNNGLGYSGELDGRSFDMAVTPGRCGDTRQDRQSPFTVTIRWGKERLDGCAEIAAP